MYNMSSVRIMNNPEFINGEAVIGRYNGHYKTIGCHANKEKNPIFQTSEGNLYIGCNDDKNCID